jgi:hypothetical protein
MGILLILISICCSSFIIFKRIKNENSIKKFIFNEISLGSLLSILACIVSILIMNIDSYSNVISYTQDKTKIEMAINNPQITGEERSAAIDLAINDNTIISTYRFYGNNFFTNVFFPKRIRELELFDINKIPYSTNNVKIVNESLK